MPFKWDQITKRPFYNKYAWAYEELVNKPVKENSQSIAEYLKKQFGNTDIYILDAGCGPGGYSINLGQHGFKVLGIDLSKNQLEIAQKNCNLKNVIFKQANFMDYRCDDKFDVILCRGVFNDFTDQNLREQALAHFYSLLKDNGLLFLDVRNWENSREAIKKSPKTKRTVLLSNGRLEFSSSRTLNDDQTYDLVETHRLITDDSIHSESFNFKMVCATQDQLTAQLTRAGFKAPAFFGAYDFKTPVDESVYIISISQK